MTTDKMQKPQRSLRFRVLLPKQQEVWEYYIRTFVRCQHIKSEISRCELEKPIQGKTKRTSFEVCPVLRGLMDEMGTIIRNYNAYSYTPEPTSSQMK
jgi:translation initiation factor 2 beta subunit (eIF-2beta)/eIF-5